MSKLTPSRGGNASDFAVSGPDYRDPITVVRGARPLELLAHTVLLLTELLELPVALDLPLKTANLGETSESVRRLGGAPWGL